jgi:hypothetical protein
MNVQSDPEETVWIPLSRLHHLGPTDRAAGPWLVRNLDPLRDDLLVVQYARDCASEQVDAATRSKRDHQLNGFCRIVRLLGRGSFRAAEQQSGRKWQKQE